MPAKKKNQTSMAKIQCCLCCQPIVKGKDESLFCGGDCQQWLHRYCAGVSVPVYKSITEKDATFFCFPCCLARHRAEIDSLKDTIDHLKAEISELKSSPLVHHPTPRTAPPVPSPPSESPSPASHPRYHPADIDRRQERKFNIVLYGIDESPSGTSKSNCLEKDLEKAITIASTLDQSINSQSIKDIYRLGRFSAESKKPRPLLVKFIRAVDASSVLSKRGSSRGTPVVIKPDMSLKERKSESMLLKERWSLIQSGVPREVIKIRGSRLLVRNKLHSQVTMSGSDLSFCRHDSCSDVNNSSSLPIVSTPSLTTQLSQSQTLPVPLNVDGCSSTSHDSSPAHPPLISSPPPPPPQSSTPSASDQ